MNTTVATRENKTINVLCGAALVLSVLTVIMALIGQTYWFWGFDSWGMLRIVGVTKVLFVAAVVMVTLSGIAKLAETKTRLVIATLSMLILVYPIKYLDLTSWTPNSARTIQGKYAFTTDWVTTHEGVWNEKLKHLKGRPNVRDHWRSEAMKADLRSGSLKIF